MNLWAFTLFHIFLIVIFNYIIVPIPMPIIGEINFIQLVNYSDLFSLIKVFLFAYSYRHSYQS